MRRLRFLLPAVLAMLLTGCQTRMVGTYAATGYAGDPRRVFIVNGMSDEFGAGVATGFSGGIETQLQRCGITTKQWRPDAMMLDGEARLASAIRSFAPDLVLRVRVQGVNRTRSQYATVVSKTLGVTALEPQGRTVWETTVVTRDEAIASNTERRGANLARGIVLRMTSDHILPACATQPATASPPKGADPAADAQPEVAG
jgi:hypothetical protein